MKKRIKIALWLLGLFVLFVMLHNVFYAIFKFEDPVFFFLSVIFAILFVGAVFCDIFIYIERLMELRTKFKTNLKSRLKKIKRKR